MNDLRILAAATSLTVLLIYCAVKILRIGRRPDNYPPGPPTVPILGNLHLMPKDRPHIQFTKWAQEYGPIYSLILDTKTYVVLSSPTVVKELLDKRANIYSSRPEMYMGQTVASGGLRLVVMEYGTLWRKMHKMIHSIFNMRAAITYVPYQDLENKQMLNDLLESPKEYVHHIRRFSNSLTTQMVYGFRTHDRNDRKLKQLSTSFDHFGELASGASSQLLDLYPILRRLHPFIRPNYRYAQNLHKVEMELYLGHWMNTKRGLEKGTGNPCFSNDVLRVQDQEQMTDEQAAYLSGSLLEAGSDTTSSTTVGFIQAMMVFSEMQRKAQAELDCVVGLDRMPTVEDAPNLPYIRAIIKETIRWMPTTIMAAPHSVIQDDYYEVYKIPKGASVLINVWGLHMDPTRNPNPRVFDPERFADDLRTEFESATSRDPSRRNNYIFGAGRRVCQGMHIAERSLFLAISRLLWAFDFERPVGPQTGKVKPLPDIDDLRGNLAVEPAPFEVSIVPRSAEKARLVRDTWSDTEKTLLNSETKQWAKIPEGMAFSTWMPDKSDE